MTSEERTLIQYRLDRARETLEEAKLLLDTGHLNAYVNRLYYACFYAVSALLLFKNFSTSKHAYLRSLFHREFVKTGVIPKNMGKHFDRLFDNRIEGDYKDLTVFIIEDIKCWMEQTTVFVNQIDEIIQDWLKSNGPS